MTFFLLWNTELDALKIFHFALFVKMDVYNNQGLSSFIKHKQKYNKNSPYNFFFFFKIHNVTQVHFTFSVLLQSLILRLFYCEL